MPSALITGASAGIGEAFAERLAADGYDLVLAARRIDLLEALADRLIAAHGIGAEAVQADLSEPAAVHELEARAAGVDLLVNNAGFGAYRPFLDLEPDIAEDLVNVHVLATVRLSRAALTPMVQRGSGAIVNVASMLAFSGAMDIPHLKRAVYAGAKSFITTFTRLLAAEVAGTGVRVMLLLPRVVATEFHTVQGLDLSHAPRMTAADVAGAAMAGLALGETVCIPTLRDTALVDRFDDAALALYDGPGSGSDSTDAAERYGL